MKKLFLVMMLAVFMTLGGTSAFAQEIPVTTNLELAQKVQEVTAFETGETYEQSVSESKVREERSAFWVKVVESVVVEVATALILPDVEHSE
ncbi:hypothetical protein [Paenibacillus popilliae]|uniref:Outer membrane receptor protein n=1 Tax=Paenibacillus popilliae ATCC 14706 TaxID=1212764 RepID=M9LNV7_PAEPP|nr:hypothetical protein [Paenibacillus popilliae]GAC42101.1 outer membrane receptor protein [Paenibacillus popilliae ATCC 14706]